MEKVNLLTILYTNFSKNQNYKKFLLKILQKQFVLFCKFCKILG